jgi:hypothetical protein
MLCPECKKKMKCVETRDRRSVSVYRRYRCRSCGKRFSSKEVLVGRLGEESVEELVSEKVPAKSAVAQPPSLIVAPVLEDEDEEDEEDEEAALDSYDGDDYDDDECEDDLDESDEWDEDDDEDDEDGGDDEEDWD